MLTKAATPEVKALYDQAMAIFNSYAIARVYASEITMVIDRKPNATEHDIWFYNFSKGPERFAQLVNAGEYMLLDSGLSEIKVVNSMRGLPTVLTEARERCCQIETGLPYLVATGKADLPERPRGRGYLRRSKEVA
jgi:hypothetical protein